MNIKEQKEKRVVFSWGRFNPVTSGHEILANKIKSIAKQKRATPIIYLSHSHDSSRNPLSYNDKYKFARRAFGNVIQKSNAKIIIKALQEIGSKYDHLTLVVGGDRIQEFEKLISKYNESDFHFDSFEVVSAGDRSDPDSEEAKSLSAKSMSASVMRRLASEGDKEGFIKGLPSKLKSSADEVYNAVRSGMNIKEEKEKEEDDNTDNTELKKSEKPKKKGVKEKGGQSPQIDTEPVLNEDQMDEVLNIAQRRKRAMTFRKNRAKIQRARERASNRRAPLEKLEKRAKRQAINIVRAKVSGGKDTPYADLSVGEKQVLDKKVAKKQALIQKLAKRLLPKVRKAEQERFAKRNEDIDIEFDMIQEDKFDVARDRMKRELKFKKDAIRQQEKRGRDALERRTDTQLKNLAKKQKQIADNKHKDRLATIRREKNRTEEYQNDQELFEWILKMDLLREAAYDGNIGIMELVKFYQKASKTDVSKLESLIKEKKNKDAWKLVQKITGVKLVGKEFNEAPFDPYKIKKIMSFTFKKKKYDAAVKLMKQIIDKKKKENNLKHDINWYADKVAKQIPGIEVRLLVSKYQELYEAKVIKDGQGGAGERGTDKLTKRYKKDTPGEDV